MIAVVRPSAAVGPPLGPYRETRVKRLRPTNNIILYVRSYLLAGTILSATGRERLLLLYVYYFHVRMSLSARAADVIVYIICVVCVRSVCTVAYLETSYNTVTRERKGVLICSHFLEVKFFYRLWCCRKK